MSKYWFKRKRYGWGWVPSTWQGWLVMTIYLAAMLAGVLTIQDVPEGSLSRELGFYLMFVGVATASMLHITYRTSPKPKWRWGQAKNDNPDEDY